MKNLILICVALLLFSVSVNAQRRHHIPTLIGDGITDDTKALNAWGRGDKVLYKGKVLGNVLENGKFLITWRIDFDRPFSTVRNNIFVWKYTGYDRTDWINPSFLVKYHNNRVIDVGMGESPFKRKRRQ